MGSDIAWEALPFIVGSDIAWEALPFIVNGLLASGHYTEMKNTEGESALRSRQTHAHIMDDAIVIAKEYHRRVAAEVARLDQST